MFLQGRNGCHIPPQHALHSMLRKKNTISVEEPGMRKICPVFAPRLKRSLNLKSGKSIIQPRALEGPEPVAGTRFDITVQRNRDTVSGGVLGVFWVTYILLPWHLTESPEKIYLPGSLQCLQWMPGVLPFSPSPCRIWIFKRWQPFGYLQDLQV